MNFLSTLLAYMAATLVVAVESTATPSVTPVPTPSPTPGAAAIVDTVTEAPTLAATATPEATVSVTPVPVPTITPNAKAYHNLARGDKGDEVRRLQEKLIELGYLPEGSADGAYGNQTRMAVRRFQYYNSLTVDGVAGRATQTNLFENPDVMPYPNQETPTPEAAESPAPEETLEETDEGGETAGLTDNPEEVEETSPIKTTQSGKETAEPEPEMTQKETAAEDPAEGEKAAAEPSEALEEAEEEGPGETEETGAEGHAEPEDAAAEDPAEMEGTEAEGPGETEGTGAEGHAEPEDAAAEGPAETEGTEAEVPAEMEETMTVTPPPAADGEEQVEEIDLDELESLPTFAPTPVPEKINYEDVAGWVVLNDSGESMQWTELEDGVPVVRSPRLQRNEEDIRVSLDDLCKSVEAWTLTDEGQSLVMEAQGFTFALLEEDSGLVSTVDGLEMVVDTNDIDFGEGHYIRADFLCRALDGSWEWDEEEETLMLRIPEKNPALYSD